ncbi:hypothetical protein M407DRAFT_24021 [Tulasnella calospora MUT 4182]|uniref:Uncharacterized protein n=1 Tax=Tulasnella calospora MUT 4182 TaxID=1051891 RepID=A0A0C3KZ91_9AGAM|nr:hypothetical protein M407DRAFT_24021 [Tulasnella calospora MUT 4182]
MSTNPANQPSQHTNSSRGKTSKKTITRGQLAIQAAAAASDQESGEINTANNRKLRDTMAAKNGLVAENILRERALGEEFVAGGGILTDGNNAEVRLKKLGVPVDAAGRSPSSLVAAASSSPLSEQDRFSYVCGSTVK